MAGMPVNPIDSLIRQGAKELTVVNNDAGNGDTAGYEPPSGLPDLAEVLRAAGQLPQDLFAIVEQDVYPLPDLDAPMPIAQRTYMYLSSCLRRQGVRS
jgi:hypothetical protein